MKNWMVGAEGETIDFDQPSRTPIYLTTIAKALSQENRWGGHSRFAVPVTQHSLIVARLMMNKAPTGQLMRYARVGLLHDAHEAYTKDVPTPIKRRLGNVWYEFEHEWQDHVLRALGVADDFYELAAHTKQCDLAALVIEREAAHRRGLNSWGPEIDNLKPNEREVARFSPHLPQRSERAFLRAARCWGIRGS